ncbi:MAG: A24 family peptidase [Planctomycetes bacterium]|nr:A24 family peptidase [Planctomycetota bacterium]
MPNLELIQVLFIITQVVFAFAFGACVGSLTNVLVYRLPLGLSVVSPPSRCPKCSTMLTWRENIPIFGWLLLRGKCRFCKAPISAEYPLVETFVAAMFAVFYALWYIVPADFVWLGVPWGSIKPEWALNGFGQTWPAFITLLTLLSCLVAMTLVDAKTFTIPLVLTWVPVLVALLLHPLGAWLNSTTLFGGFGGGLRLTARGEVWAMATPGPAGWWWIGASIGGVIGLGIANVMIAKGWLTRSFADYEEWEKGQSQASGTQDKASGIGPQASGGIDAGEPVQGGGTASGEGDNAAMSGTNVPLSGTNVTNAGIRAVSAGSPNPDSGSKTPIVPVSSPDQGDSASPSGSALSTSGGQNSALPLQAEMWIQYPHARREMVKELAFLAPCAVLMMVGGALAVKVAGPWAVHPATGRGIPAFEAPLWLVALGGVLMGYLIGGGIVWIFRILGSLGFGKEAIGLGDVHLMAAVGAVLGWIDPILAFFGAAFVGIAFQIVKVVSGGRIRRAMAYGPCLAIATVLVILCKPGIERAMTAILKSVTPIDLP